MIYLDAILYLGSGIIGTGHHWYWTGQSNITHGAGRDVLGDGGCAADAAHAGCLGLHQADARHSATYAASAVSIPHKWTFYFLMAVGFWNFVGAGVFGFLINLPIVSYFEVGTMLTPNHGHAAMMGVFGMLAMALMVFALRQVLADEQWAAHREVRPRLVLGTEHRPGADGRDQPFPRRRPATAGRAEQRLLARAQRRPFSSGRLIKFLEWIRIVPDLTFTSPAWYRWSSRPS